MKKKTQEQKLQFLFSYEVCTTSWSALSAFFFLPPSIATANQNKKKDKYAT